VPEWSEGYSFSIRGLGAPEPQSGEWGFKTKERINLKKIEKNLLAGGWERCSDSCECEPQLSPTRKLSGDLWSD